MTIGGLLGVLVFASLVAFFVWRSRRRDPEHRLPAKTHFSRAMLGYGAAFVCAGLAGLLDSHPSAPYLFGIAACLITLGLWLRWGASQGNP